MCRSLSLNKGFDCRATVKPPVSGEFRMKSLYAAWLGDPGPGDLVEVECVCGHSQALTASMLATAGMGSPTRGWEALRDDQGVAAPPPVPGGRRAGRWEMGSAILC